MLGRTMPLFAHVVSESVYAPLYCLLSVLLDKFFLFPPQHLLAPLSTQLTPGYASSNAGHVHLLPCIKTLRPSGCHMHNCD